MAVRPFFPPAGPLCFGCRRRRAVKSCARHCWCPPRRSRRTGVAPDGSGHAGTDRGSRRCFSMIASNSRSGHRFAQQSCRPALPGRATPECGVDAGAGLAPGRAGWDDPGCGQRRCRGRICESVGQELWMILYCLVYLLALRRPVRRCPDAPNLRKTTARHHLVIVLQRFIDIGGRDGRAYQRQRDSDFRRQENPGDIERQIDSVPALLAIFFSVGGGSGIGIFNDCRACMR